VRLALYLLLYTGQRECDVIAMQWDHIRDGMIRVKQCKTSEVVWIAIDPALQAVPDASHQRIHSQFRAWKAICKQQCSGQGN